MEEMITFVGNDETGYFIVENPTPEVIHELTSGRSLNVRHEWPQDIELSRYQTLYKFSSTAVIIKHLNGHYSYFSLVPVGISAERLRFTVCNNAAFELGVISTHQIRIDNNIVHHFSHPVGIFEDDTDMIISFQSNEDLMEWKLHQ